MNLTREANDWEVLGMCQLGGAATFGAGAYAFTFFSSSIGDQTTTFFVGGGVGGGGSAGGMSLPIESTDEEERRMLRRGYGETNSRMVGFSPLDCERSFSLTDLHNSFGNITSVGASFLVGVSLTYLTAATRNGNLFTTDGGVGFVAGIGLGATSFCGLWKVGELLFASQSQLQRRFQQEQ